MIPRDALASLESDSAAPESFALHLEQLLASFDEKGMRPPDRLQLARLAPLLACEAPSHWLRSRPLLARWLAITPWLDEERPAESFRSELALRVDALDPGDVDGLLRVLRLFRHREILRIALRDLARRAPLRTVVRELSHLADALVAESVRFCDHALASKFGPPLGEDFCVLSMGKHGSLELNYSSDIDVIFVHREPGQRARAIQLAQAVIRAMSAATVHGFAFRVDANLRPYGREGALACSLDAMERYYERAGQTWERAALIKARPCAGGLRLGEEVLERLRPFVWRRSLDMEAVEALAGMKRRIDRAQAGSGFDDVKLGRGGIREIEFLVQALQLLHGGRRLRVRTRGTLDGLDALVFSGILPAADHDALADAYVFLRDVEHRLQIPGDRQTHALPPMESAERVVLARRMGFRAPAEFEATLASHRQEVRLRFEELLATAAEELPHRPEVELALAPDAPDGARFDALHRLGFEDPVAAVTILSRLSRQADGVFGPRGRERFPGLAERLVEEMSRTPAPDHALHRLADLHPPLWNPSTIAALFANSFPTARLLLLLFATSETLSRQFQLHPEQLDVLVRRDGAALERSGEELQEDLRSRLVRLTEPEERLRVLRRFRREEALRVGLHDLAGRLDLVSVGRQLADCARVLLVEALSIAREEMSRRFGEPDNARLAVIGMGSFGAAELDYQSDLDLVLVFDGEGSTTGGERGSVSTGEWASRVGQRLISHLTLTTGEGFLYRVDTRLRPSGSQGTLMTSLRAFREYHGVDGQGGARGAALWERQSLLRAQAVTGDPSLCEEVTRVLEFAAFERPLPGDVADQILTMRRRLDVPVNSHAIDPKRSPGGLLDVEFLVQFAQLQSQVRGPGTLSALERLEDAGHPVAEVAADLRRGYVLLRSIESRLRLMFSRPEVFIPRTGYGPLRLARQMGDAGPDAGERLLRDVERVMHRNREMLEALVR